MSGGWRIGIDVGGTKMLGVVLDDDGDVVTEIRRPTPRGVGSIDHLSDTLVEVVAALTGGDRRTIRHRGQVRSVGIGVPGLITADGVVAAAANLDDVDSYPIGAIVSERLGIAVDVENDGTCTAVAEWQLGVGRGCSDLVSIALGTGVGGGVIAGGRVVRGANGFAGEFGHMLVDPHGPACPCGRSGCWERYASGTGLATLAHRAASAGDLDEVVAHVGGDPAAVQGEDVLFAARQGDRGALAVIEEFGRWVAVGLANLTNALDPELFVLGGGMSTGADVYLPPIERWFPEMLYHADRRPIPRIAFAELGERAGAIGAALLADR